MAGALLETEVLCIGSSPLLLLEALQQARSGRRVLVVDAAEQVGGAWRDMRIFGLRRVEIAPHIVMYNRTTYDYFARELGVKMQRMLPPPQYFWNSPLGKIWIPYILSPFVAYIAVPIHFICNRQYRANFQLIREEYFGRLSDASRLMLKWIFAGQQPFIEYPTGGTLELLDRISDRLAEAGVKLRMKTRVAAIETQPGKNVWVRCEDGLEIAAAKVFMTRHQNVPRISVAGRPLEVQYDSNTYTSLHLLVKTTNPSRAAFVLAKRDPWIQLYSDLTSYMADVPQGRRVITLRLPPSDRPQDRTAAEAVMKHLVEYRYLSTDVKLEDFHFSTYQQGGLKQECIQTLEAALGDVVTIFRSTNMSNSIGDRISFWKNTRRKLVCHACAGALTLQDYVADVPQL